MLIDRVKDTLSDIKNKSKRENQDQDKYVTVDFDTDKLMPPVSYEPPCCEIRDSARPKTRRPMSCEKKSDVEDKFKNTIGDPLKPIDSLELLQGKLNTIIEQAETDSSSSSESNHNAGVKATADVNVQIEEERMPKQSSAVQIKPEVTSIGVQNIYTNSKTVSVQTDAQPKKLCVTTNCVATIVPHNTKLCKMDKLNIQHMPPITIKRKLVTQRILMFYIDNQGRTHSLPQSKAKNIRFHEITHISPQSDLKIRIGKEMKSWLKRASSEVSTFMTQKDGGLLPIVIPSKKPTDARRMRSFSDGELITLRKEQLKESRKPQTPVKVESISKELILKSYHIYDNPNVHDPGETHFPVNVSSMDTFIYKNYINPDGIPTTVRSLSNCRTGNMITPEILQQISQHKSMKNQYPSNIDTKKVISTTGHKTRPSEETKIKRSIISEDVQNLPINLYDLGLYSAKATQVESGFLKSSKSSVPEKSKVASELPPTHEKSSFRSTDRGTDTSYEKISITVSYSSEETVSSDSINKDINKPKASDYIEKHEQELQRVEPLQQNTNTAASAISKGSQETFHILREKFAREGFQDQQKPNNSSIPSLSMESLESTTLPQFITGLTEASSRDIRKILPHIRKNVSDKRTKISESNFVKSTSSGKLNSDHNQLHYSSSSRSRRSKKDFTVLSMQIHGDCIPTDPNVMDSPLELGKNGRYKDEEDLFCDGDPKLTNLPLRRRVSKDSPIENYVNKYILESSGGDSISVEPSFSEGEIKCHSSASIGEVRRRPHLDQFSKIRQKMTKTNHGSEANVIRERRTYFNHWITYYINKNAQIPLLSNSSSTSST